MSQPSCWPHADGLRLVVSSLGAVVVDEPAVRSVRAEDASGGFGLWPGHADFLTVLGVGILAWRGDAGTWRYCALRGGVLTLRRGCDLAVATREAIRGDDLGQLEGEVLSRLAQRQQVEEAARREARELEVRALRLLVRPPLRAMASRSPP